mmetsp:Transcript_39426/g.91441  ORF Transcript_39426/g.91441 Transcript_39426/m.91441 type:complete len:150 (-) Transcript_39426:63-512(-)|eukprot:CAMPEP_0171061936 /NCGR_PEP_ID=MMETSP0766_2-20121228/4763_1 /TAXON_ID=439317 /ORGANISM="Gambierdiscus australes, Strain CAWD 149" /LENGTH=149 /DNA_ID=CAMNT_0011517687 /DNA_START=48 /DNA_END=497 /DNA_ORIENTATION=-
MEASSLPGAVVGASRVHGHGVFATRAFQAGEVVEVCPCLEVCRESLERAAPERGADLRDYLFDVQPQGSERASTVMLLPLGCGMAYNHRSDSNLSYVARLKDKKIIFRARCYIPTGDELFIDYGEEWWTARGWKPMAENFTLLRVRLGS